VTANKEITVAAWVGPPRSIAPAKRVQMRFLPPALIGVLGTLMIHTLALQTAFVGSRAHKIRLPEVQQPGSAKNSAAGPADNLVFIDLPRIASTNGGLDEALASLRAAMKEKPIPVKLPNLSPPTEVEVLALSEDNPSESSGSGDGADRARLFGIYIGQIQARVERIWRRPRTPVKEVRSNSTAAGTAESFQCQVQISQDAAGNVQEILLLHCNGTPAWQRSLVLAIQQASPLPAPPSETVFSHSVTLNFIGLSYTAGSLEDDYEIVPMHTAQTLSNPSPIRPH
jgi:TonB-like protein